MKSILPCALILGSLALSIQAGLAETSHTNTVAATPNLPAPSGTFGIGRVGYEWIDRSRPDSNSSDPQAHRDLMVYLWYPSPRENTAEPGWYLPGAKAMDADPDLQPHMRQEFEAAWPL